MSFHSSYVTFSFRSMAYFLTAIVGIPVGILISRKRKLANWVIRFAKYHPNDSFVSHDLDLDDRVRFRSKCRDRYSFLIFATTDHQEHVHWDDPSRQKYP